MMYFKKNFETSDMLGVNVLFQYTPGMKGKQRPTKSHFTADSIAGVSPDAPEAESSFQTFSL